MANTGQHDFIEFVCKPVEDLYLSSGEKRVVRIPKLTEYRCSMLRDQHFHSLFRHYGKHNGVDKETLVFFFTEELMQELESTHHLPASFSPCLLISLALLQHSRHSKTLQILQPGRHTSECPPAKK